MPTFKFQKVIQTFIQYFLNQFLKRFHKFKCIFLIIVKFGNQLKRILKSFWLLIECVSVHSFSQWITESTSENCVTTVYLWRYAAVDHRANCDAIGRIVSKIIVSSEQIVLRHIPKVVRCCRVGVVQSLWSFSKLDSFSFSFEWERRKIWIANSQLDSIFQTKFLINDLVVDLNAPTLTRGLTTLE